MMTEVASEPKNLFVNNMEREPLVINYDVNSLGGQVFIVLTHKNEQHHIVIFGKGSHLETVKKFYNREVDESNNEPQTLNDIIIKRLNERGIPKRNEREEIFDELKKDYDVNAGRVYHDSKDASFHDEPSENHLKILAKALKHERPHENYGIYTALRPGRKKHGTVEEILGRQ